MVDFPAPNGLLMLFFSPGFIDKFISFKTCTSLLGRVGKKLTALNCIAPFNFVKVKGWVSVLFGM